MQIPPDVTTYLKASKLEENSEESYNRHDCWVQGREME